MEQNKIQIAKDKILEGVVTGITNFGVFVNIGDNVNGLVHISEITQGYIKDINDIFKVGDVVKVKVLKIENNGKISLSIKQVYELKQRERTTASLKRQTPIESKEATFEDKLARFMKNSEEIQIDVKRNKDLTRKKKRKR